MEVSTFLVNLEAPRKKVLAAIHKLILKTNKNVKAEIGSMMRMEMIIYKLDGVFIYGLASGKNHMSLHAMPIYASKEIHSKYSSLLPDAVFQKGCINFKDEEDMPLDIIEKLLKDCSKIDYRAIFKLYSKK